MKYVGIIDYGMGNLFSVQKAFEQFECKVDVIDKVELIKECDYLVLPGVGAFTKGMDELSKKNLIDPIIRFSKTGRPFLGICLGMQMLMEESCEFETTKGLGIIEGNVIKIPDVNKHGVKHKVPHVGWSELLLPCESKGCTFPDDSIFKGIDKGSEAYFVHSYMANPANFSNRLADVSYNGVLLTAAIRKDNIFGCQFHPEKSGELGLRIIDKFLKIK